MTSGNVNETVPVGLYIDLRGFDEFRMQHGSAAAAVLRERFVARAIEIGRDHRMEVARELDNTVLFTGDSEQVALLVAYAIAEQFAPDHPYFPVRITHHLGGARDTDDRGKTIELITRISAAPYPADLRPAERGTRA